MTLNLSTLSPFNNSTLPACLKPWHQINGMVKIENGRTVYQYHPSDSLTLSERNLADYEDDQFLYSVNSIYFRADELSRKDNRNSILFLGCSHTFGIGLSNEDCYADIVSKKLNLKNWNYSAGGLDPGTSILIFRQLLNAGYVPKYAFILWPEWSRKLMSILELSELIRQLKENSFDTDRTPMIETFVDSIVNDNVIDWNKILYVLYGEAVDAGAILHSKEKHNKLTFLRKLWAGVARHQSVVDFIHYRNQFKDLCEKHNITGVEAHVNTPNLVLSKILFKDNDTIRINRHFQEFKVDHARDNQHQGPKSNKLWAKEILSVIQKD